MTGRLTSLVLALGAFLAVSPSLAASDPEANPGFPTASPVRERVLGVDDQAVWTLRRGEPAVPLTVVPTPGRTVVALSGGWVTLGPDLDVLPSSLDLLASDQPPGSPWAQAVGAAVVFVSGSPGDLAVLYPDPAVVVRRSLDLAGLSFFSVTDQGFFFVQGRRTSTAPAWDRLVREVQPLLFFPADLTAAPDGTAWAVDSLQARPWRQEGEFWKPLEVPKTPGRLTTLAPFPDSTGYFAGGPGWVGAFSSDGTPFWVRDKDFAGKPLPRDLKVRAGAGRVYFWSAQGRKVWCWGWDSDGPTGAVAAPSPDRLADMVRSEADRLEALGSVPEAASVAQYGVELARTFLKAQPFSPLWTRAADEFSARKQALRQRVVGAGVFTLAWSAPSGVPLASWTWEPDADWTDVQSWRAAIRPWWEGRPYEPDDFRLAATADQAPWPGVEGYRQGDLRLPSWMTLELRPEGSDAPVHWARLPLPAPPIPYELPVE
jgi:hypothetical protein